MKTKVTYTGQLTVNKTVKRMVKEMFPTMAKLYKKHVAGIGCVYLVKDAQQNILSKVYKYEDMNTREIVIYG